MARFPAFVRACSLCYSKRIRKRQWEYVNTGDIEVDLDAEEECADCGSREVVDASLLPTDKAEDVLE